MSPIEAKEAADAVKHFMTGDALKIVGIEAKKHFQEGFQTDHQGFTDDHLEKWKPLTPATVKRKTRKNGTTPPILTDKGHLRDSIDWEGDYNDQVVIMSSDLPYAEVHNEGGGPKNMPKRQFMGPSKQLEEKIVAKFEKQLDKIFGR
jgi:phage gpG-like protein